DPLGRERLRRAQRLRHLRAGGKDHRVLSVAQRLDPAEAEDVVLGVDAVDVLPRQPQVCGPLVVGEIADHRLRLHVVCRLDHRHRRQRPHQGDVLQALLRVTVVADRDAGVGADDADVGLGIRDRDADLVVTAGDEAGEGAGEGDLAAKRQPGGGPEHVRLLDSHLEEAIGELLPEELGLGRLGEVGVQDDDVLALLAEPHQRLAECLPGCLLDAHDLFSSSMARAACSAFGATPCQSTTPSMKETPLPLTVFAMTKVGLPLVACASSMARRKAPMSWPSMVTTCQLKDSSFSRSGSMSITSFTNPSIWALL